MQFMCQQHKHAIVIHEEIICPFCSTEQNLKDLELICDEVEQAQVAMEKELEKMLGEEKADELIAKIDNEKAGGPDAKNPPTTNVNNDEITNQ